MAEDCAITQHHHHHHHHHHRERERVVSGHLTFINISLYLNFYSEIVIKTYLDQIINNNLIYV